MVDEEDIIRGCRKFENTSQKELYNRFHKKMYGLCLRYISDKDDAKDILQDGFVQVFTNFNKYKGEGSLEGWLRKLFVNTALMYLRKKKKITFEQLDDYSNAQPLEQAESAITSADFTTAELYNTISLLPEDYKIVFNMFCIENYSHKEISELLSINENTSRTRLNRARNLLQGYLTKIASKKQDL
jgi:RNA polymerase sigma factor (sigma-70 family)